MPIRKVFTLVLVLTGMRAGLLRAQQVDPPPLLDSLVSEALEQNREVAAADGMARAAAARVPQAGALPDPTLGLGLMNVPVKDPSLRREMMTMTTVQVGARLPFPGKLARAEDAARAGADAARLQVEVARRALIARVKSAYYRLWFLDRALEVTSRNVSLLGDIGDVTEARYRVGDGTQPHVLRAQVERARLRQRVASLQEERSAALSDLNALRHAPADAPVGTGAFPDAVLDAATVEAGASALFEPASLPGSDTAPGSSPAPGLPSLGELQAIATQRNPELAAARHRIEQREQQERLAERATLPDVAVTVGYGHRPAFGDLMTLNLSVPIPIFAGRKQAQGVREADALVSGERARYEALADEVARSVATLSAQLRGTRERILLLDDAILPQARTALAAATAAYRVGGSDFLTLLDAQSTLYTHDVDRYRLLTDFATTLAALERVVGQEILP